jgi:hypothetical protein
MKKEETHWSIGKGVKESTRRNSEKVYGLPTLILETDDNVLGMLEER